MHTFRYSNHFIGPAHTCALEFGSIFRETFSRSFSLPLFISLYLGPYFKFISIFFFNVDFEYIFWLKMKCVKTFVRLGHSAARLIIIQPIEWTLLMFNRQMSKKAIFFNRNKSAIGIVSLVNDSDLRLNLMGNFDFNFRRKQTDRRWRDEMKIDVNSHEMEHSSNYNRATRVFFPFNEARTVYVYNERQKEYLFLSLKLKLCATQMQYILSVFVHIVNAVFILCIKLRHNNRFRFITNE